MKKKSSLQIKIEYAAVRMLLGSLSVLPRRGALFVSSMIGRMAFHTLSSLRRTGLRNLEIAFPEMPGDERTEMVKGTFRNLGRVLGEVSQFGKYSPADIAKIVDFELDEVSERLYERVKNEGKGVLITTGHLGNWELLVYSFAALHQPIAYLARALDNPLIEDLTVRVRTRLGNRPINKSNSAMTAIKLLRGGEILGVLADINAHPKEGVFVPFFGVEACTSSGPATMALRTNSLIFPVFCVFDASAGRYKVVHGDVIEYQPTDDRQADIRELTAIYTAQIEKIIREYPDQWLWIHKRWKTRPPGQPGLY